MKDLHIDVEDGERLSLPFLTLIAALDPGWRLNSSELINSKKGHVLNYEFWKASNTVTILCLRAPSKERSWRVLRMSYTPEHTVTCLLMSNEFLGLQNGLTELRKTSTLLLGLSISTVWEWKYMRNLLAETIDVSKPRMPFSFLLADRLVQGYVCVCLFFLSLSLVKFSRFRRIQLVFGFSPAYVHVSACFESSDSIRLPPPPSVRPGNNRMTLTLTQVDINRNIQRCHCLGNSST
ncbi:hypothetical protein F5051DRAFT_170220 [Lentinula edodes]|nr:hypothetical protein F5051DRAFT_170220 [Lentinula edodes]